MMTTTNDLRLPTMDAVVQDKFGPPSVLRLATVDRPVPGSGDVLVRVRAASVGAWDWHDMQADPHIMRLLGLGLRTPKNRILGLDFAGEIEEVGSDVTRFKPGDAVYGESANTYARYVVASEDSVAHKPANLSFTEAAASVIAGVTALLGLRDQGELEHGQKVLIVGAAGGVGSFAVQIAKAMGAEVTAVCATESAAIVRSLGADHVIDYRKQDFVESNERFDVILQAAGTAAPSACRRVLTRHGTLVLTSGDGGPWIGAIGRIIRGLVLSVFVPQRVRVYVAKASTNHLDELTELLEAGDVTPLIESTYELADAAEAVARFGSEHGPGKIVITI